MNFAALETSSEWCSVALALGDEIHAAEERAGNRTSERVLPMLEELLARAGLAPRDLEAIAFGAGPGSFTGLRIACGVAQGLAAARELPVLGISSFEALAEDSGASRALVCIDARMNEVYCAALERVAAPGGTAWREALPPACAAARSLTPPPGAGWIGCGSGFAAYRDELQSVFGAALAGIRDHVHPGAVAVARLARPRLEAGEGVDAALAAPTYLRDKVALTKEEQRRR